MVRRKKDPRRRAVEQFIVHWVMVATRPLIRALPIGGIRSLGSAFGALVDALSHRRRRMADANIRAALGQSLSDERVRSIRRQSAINIAKTALELLKLQWLTPEDVRRLISIDGAQHIDQALARGKGVVLVTAHFGNWELTGAILAVMGYSVNVIARDANDPVLRGLMNDGRQSKGIKVFGRWDARHLLRALRNNECVAILPDQHAAEAAVRVTFLGRPADTATGPATFALRTGAAVVPLFSYRQPDDHIHCQVFAPLEIRETGDRDADILAVTQQINDTIGEQILRHPEQWLWLHDRWKADTPVGSE